MARIKRIIICPDCKQEKKHEARGLCYTCYNRIKIDLPTRPKVNCVVCNELKPHNARQMCKNCYTVALNRKRYAEGKINRISVKCNSCGEIKPHKAHGCCDNCYAAIRQRKTYHENDEIKRKKLLKCRDYRKLKQISNYGKCNKCGEEGRRHIHHLSYEENKLDVEFLCKKCHMEKHRKHTYNWW